jgi:hypothetical protein
MRKLFLIALFTLASTCAVAQTKTLRWFQVDEVKGNMEFVDAQTGKVVALIAGPVQASQEAMVPDTAWKGKTLLARGQMQGGWFAYAELLGVLTPPEPSFKSLKMMKRSKNS